MEGWKGATRLNPCIRACSKQVMIGLMFFGFFFFVCFLFFFIVFFFFFFFIIVFFYYYFLDTGTRSSEGRYFAQWKTNEQ